ncbi:HET-domain-containing protein [Annulohypoxylon moriforme]|nr:HET-domain-containing protein [Annulohypoxylon moriforme]
MPICNICREGFEGIWDPSKTKRVCTINEWGRDPWSLHGRPESQDPESPNAPENFIFGHHATEASFIQAVKEGCICCTNLKRALHNTSVYQEIRSEKLSLGYYTVFCIVTKPTPLVEIYIENQRTYCFKMVQYDYNSLLNPIISPYTGDQGTWGIIQGWLNECSYKHTSCMRKDTAVYIPSRLIKLDYTTSDPTFCVVERRYADPKCRYLTLSHCWGAESESPRLRLTRSTLKRFSEEQPCSNLPKTFREATEVAKRLQICYLWIDSLCILQDYPDDWQKESTSMHDVYGNAFLNIAALGAKNNDGGLFFSRDPTKVQPTVFNLGVNGPKDLRLYLAPHEEYAWEDGLSDEPLLRRGWVVQERVLSQRVLYFGSRQVFWECYETPCCETHPKLMHGYSSRKAKTDPKYVWKPLLDRPYTGILEQNDTAQLFSEWYSFLETYTKCELTEPKDKLVALSGIVKDMKRHLTTLGWKDTKYLAGMWSQKLPQDLNWSLWGVGNRPDEYRAPSWSWASVDGDFEWFSGIHDEDELIASVTHAWTIPANCGDETGEVSRGMLTLNGILITADLSPRSETKDSLGSNAGYIIEFRNYEDGTILPQTERSNPDSDDIHIYYLWKHVCFDTKENHFHQVLCLPTTFNKDRDGVRGLAMTQDRDGNYRRVGLFTIKDTRGDCIRSIFENASRGEVNIV